MADGTAPQKDSLASLADRVSFLESWLQVPAQYLPGYVAPPAATEEVAEEATTAE